MSSAAKTDYERTDVSPRLLAGIAAGLAATVAMLAVALRLAFPQSADDRAVMAAPPAPPEPRLQESPTGDLADFRRLEEERLSSYGWVDRPAGIVRMPIEQAIEATVRRGLPGWTKAAP